MDNIVEYNRIDGSVLNYDSRIQFGPSGGIYLEQERNGNYWITDLWFNRVSQVETNSLQLSATYLIDVNYKMSGSSIYLGIERGRIVPLSESVRVKLGCHFQQAYSFGFSSRLEEDAKLDGEPYQYSLTLSEGGNSHNTILSLRLRLERTIRRKVDLGLMTWYSLQGTFFRDPYYQSRRLWDNNGILISENESVTKYKDVEFGTSYSLIPAVYLSYRF